MFSKIKLIIKIAPEFHVEIAGITCKLSKFIGKTFLFCSRCLCVLILRNSVLSAFSFNLLCHPVNNLIKIISNCCKQLLVSGVDTDKNSIICIKMTAQMILITELNGVVYSVKSNDSKPEPRATPHEILSGDEKQSPVLTLWCLPLSSDLNPLKATPDTPYHKDKRYVYVCLDCQRIIADGK